MDLWRSVTAQQSTSVYTTLLRTSQDCKYKPNTTIDTVDEKSGYRYIYVIRKI